jgi:hypothetical protein
MPCDADEGRGWPSSSLLLRSTRFPLGRRWWLVQRAWLSYQAHTASSQPAFWLADACGSAGQQAYRGYLDWWTPYEQHGYPK